MEKTTLPQQTFTIIPKNFDKYYNYDPTVSLDFFNAQKKKIESPEMTLWYEVLTLALYDYQDALKNHDVHKFHELYQWFFHTEKSPTLGSFTWICESINIDKHLILKLLKQSNRKFDLRHKL